MTKLVFARVFIHPFVGWQWPIVDLQLLMVKLLLVYWHGSTIVIQWYMLCFMFVYVKISNTSLTNTFPPFFPTCFSQFVKKFFPICSPHFSVCQTTSLKSQAKDPENGSSGGECEASDSVAVCPRLKHWGTFSWGYNHGELNPVR